MFGLNLQWEITPNEALIQTYFTPNFEYLSETVVMNL